jgi:hypothetical protein
MIAMTIGSAASPLPSACGCGGIITVPVTSIVHGGAMIRRPTRTGWSAAWLRSAH